ncbi:hypothetical protein [Blastopirellula retiformator]|uniref:Uncharacterized protein n=1 Tax=Blastopirellula retiformator TaxID=2527970 RepID=A0A5C5V2J1_9BACT|nr:hypothetical protein [Blastopirellula retiformator]TWT32017.1 hypothetical protein Enr8_39430 [Blastopirellula retiformator]
MLAKSSFVSVPFGLLITLATLSSATLASAGPVNFDVGYRIACRDVTPDDYVGDEKLIEAKFVVSSLVAYEAENDLLQFVIRIESGDPRMTVVDYSPRTTLENKLTGGMQIERKKESDSSLGANLTGKYDGIVSGNISGGASRKDAVTTKYELRSPVELIAASGTIHRGAGVYFKLKPARQSTLEGAKEYTCVFRVPGNWTRGLASVYCEALGEESSSLSPLDSRRTFARQAFRVALYLDINADAKRAAENYVACERMLRATTVQYRGVIEKATRHSPIDQLVSLVKHGRTNHGPKLDPTDLTTWPADELYRLPREVQDAAADYRAAQLRMRMWTDEFITGS